MTWKNATGWGGNAYVVKPVRFTEFVEAIKGIGVFWALINEPPPESVGKKCIGEH